MNLFNSRKGWGRLNTSRRIADRRDAPYAFGSPQWIEHVQLNYVAWPRQERRCRNRRSGERRQRQVSEHAQSFNKHSDILLSQEELKLIEDLYLNDCDQSTD